MIMLPMFKPKKGEKRKALIAEINRDIKETFEETFLENYQNAREQLILGGVSEEIVDEKLGKIKSELEQEIIVRAQEILKQAVLQVVREERIENLNKSKDESQSMAPPKKIGASLT